MQSAVQWLHGGKVNIRDKGHPAMDKTNIDHNAGHPCNGATSKLQNCILEFHHSNPLKLLVPWNEKLQTKSLTFPQTPLDALNHGPCDPAHRPSCWRHCPEISWRQDLERSSVLPSAQAEVSVKNGAGADSDGVPIDRLVLRLPADRLGVFCLRHIQIRHPARQEEGVAATLRALPGTPGTLALRKRHGGILHANQRLFVVLSTQMGNTRALSYSPCRARHSFLIGSPCAKTFYDDFMWFQFKQDGTDFDRLLEFGRQYPFAFPLQFGPFLYILNIHHPDYVKTILGSTGAISVTSKIPSPINNIRLIFVVVVVFVLSYRA